MMYKLLNSPVPPLAIVSLLLLCDGTGLVRMALIASFIHESGHCVIYWIQTRKIPTLRFSLCGIGLQAENLHQSRAKQTWLLCGGCLANFLTCIVVLILIEQKATYGRYFFLAANLFIGCYNLFPIGVLDGARILRLWLPDQYKTILKIVQICVSVVMLGWVIIKLIKKQMPWWIGISLIAAFSGLLYQSKNQIE